MKTLSQEDNLTIEKAIIYLVKNITETGNNPKPVITHSLSMTFMALEFGAHINIVLGCILHDILKIQN